MKVKTKQKMWSPRHLKVAVAAAIAVVCRYVPVDAREGSIRKEGSVSGESIKSSNESMTKENDSIFWDQFTESQGLKKQKLRLKPLTEENRRSLKSKSIKSKGSVKSKSTKSKASKCRDIKRDVAFLGIELAYSAFVSELTLKWDTPLFIPSICGCRENCTTSSKSGKSTKQTIDSKSSQTTNKEISESSKESVRRLSSATDETVDNFIYDDDGYITMGVEYHIFVRESPFDFFQDDFETLLSSANTTANDITNITFSDLVPRQTYSVFVLATIDDTILPNNNVFNITISHIDPALKVNVTSIPSNFTVTRVSAGNETFGLKVNNDTVTNDNMTIDNNCTEEEKEESVKPCASATCGGVDANDDDFLVDFFYVTICNDPVSSWGFDINPNDTIIFTDSTDVETDDEVRRVMHVWEVLTQNSSCVEVTAIDTSPTYLFEEVFFDSQIDAYYDLARENINKTCEEYCDSSEGGRRLKTFKKDFPFASIDVDVETTVKAARCLNRPPPKPTPKPPTKRPTKRPSSQGTDSPTSDDDGDGSLCASGQIDFELYAQATAYLRVRIEVSLSKFEAEIGGGYDYIAGFKGDGSAKVLAELEGGEDIWKRKKMYKLLFTVPVGPIPVPIFITIEPYVAYDYIMEFELKQKFEFMYEISGGDYGGIVIPGGFKQVSQESERTDGDDIFKTTACDIQVSAEVGVQAGIRLFLFDSMGTDIALRVGAKADSESTCDGRLDPASSLFYNDKEPEETQELSSFQSFLPPFRQTKFNLDVRLSLPIESTIGIRFSLPWWLGGGEFWLVKIDLGFEIDILNIPILTLPMPKPYRGQYQCQCENYPSCTDSGSLDLSVATRGKTVGKAIVDNPIVNPNTLVLVFDNTNSTNIGTWSAPNFEGLQDGTMRLSSTSKDKFCCGAVVMPPSELFLVSTPQIPPFDHSLLSYDRHVDGEDCFLFDLIEGCSLEQFYQDAIGDMVCNGTCKWDTDDDICGFEGVGCAYSYTSDRCDAPKKGNKCGRVVNITRNAKHQESGTLPGEIEHLSVLETLDLGFLPVCVDETFECLTEFFPGDESCFLANCSSPVIDLTDDSTCWTKADKECYNATCGAVYQSYENETLCTSFTKREDDEKLSGLIPAEIWTMRSLVYANLSDNAFTGFEDPIKEADYSALETGHVAYDLRNSGITEVPCDICDVVNDDFDPFNVNNFFNTKFIIVDCIDPPIINCRCCVGGYNGTEWLPCNETSIKNHEEECASPSSEPSTAPSISSQPSSSTAPSTSPSTSAEPSTSSLPTPVQPTGSPTGSSEPSLSPTTTSFPTPPPTDSLPPTLGCQKQPTTESPPEAPSEP